MKLDPAAQAAVEEYLERLDAVLADTARAGAWVYLTGSAALGDWIPAHSDLDLLVVTGSRLAGIELDALAELHAGRPGRPYRDAIYVARDELGARGSPGDPGVPHVIDGTFRRAGHELDPVLWATLDRYALTLRGPAAAELGTGPDPGWLREWNLANLTGYWRPWAADSRQLLDGLAPDIELPGDVVAWGALGPGRLHATITTGDIISKTAAAQYTAARFPRYAGLLGRARDWRLGAETVSFTAADGRLCCELVDAIVSDAERC